MTYVRQQSLATTCWPLRSETQSAHVLPCAFDRPNWWPARSCKLVRTLYCAALHGIPTAIDQKFLTPANAAVVMRSVPSVCVSVLFGSNFWKPWPTKFNFWYAGTSPEYLGQVRISRSSVKVKVTGANWGTACTSVIIHTFAGGPLSIERQNYLYWTRCGGFLLKYNRDSVLCGPQCSVVVQKKDSQTFDYFVRSKAKIWHAIFILNFYH